MLSIMYWTCASATNLADALVGRRRGQCWPKPPHARACNYFRRRGERASRGENHGRTGGKNTPGKLVLQTRTGIETLFHPAEERVGC